MFSHDALAKAARKSKLIACLAGIVAAAVAGAQTWTKVAP